MGHKANIPDLLDALEFAHYFLLICHAFYSRFTPPVKREKYQGKKKKTKPKNETKPKQKKSYNRHNVVTPSSHMGSEPVRQTLVGAVGLRVQVPIAAQAERLQNDYNTHKAEQSSPALLPETTF